MHRTLTPRKAQFKAALALNGTTLRDWCSERELTESHVHAVLKGARESRRLTTAVDEYIAESMKRAKAQRASAA